MVEEMFCVECGKKNPIVKNGMCAECYIKNHQFSKGPDEITIVQCSNCGSYKYKDSWVSEEFKDIVDQSIQDSFSVDDELTKPQFFIEITKEKGKIFYCHVKISGLLNNQEVIEEHRVKINLEKTTCEVCSRRHGGYFEAIIQIRAERRKVSEQELRQITHIMDDILDKIEEKGDRGAFVTKVQRIHGGIDVYLSRSETAHLISRKLHDKMGGEFKTSSTLVGREDGQDKYRMTYLLRLPPFKKGDIIISDDDSYYFVSAIRGTRARVINLRTWKTEAYEHKELKDVTLVGGAKDIVSDAVLVSESKTEVQVMDPQSYETVEVKKPSQVMFNSDTIKITKIDDRIILLPKDIFKYIS